MQNSSASMYAGYPGKGRRAPVTSLCGLRKVLRNETETDSAPVAAAAPVVQSAPPASAPAAAPEDDKQVLRGLNTRLTSYLDKVKELQEANDKLRKEIDDILAKRKDPAGRNWDDVQKPFEDNRQKIKDITMDNAKLMVEADNAKMANDDLKNKLDGEIHAQKVIEKDLEELKKAMEETKQRQETIKKETDMVKDEIDRIQKEHEDIVNTLCEKIRTSKVTVEIEPDGNDLTSNLLNIRKQYENIAEKNLKETDDWYMSKFENIKVVEAQNTEALESGKSEFKNKLKEKQQLDLMIQSLMNKIQNLEEVLRKTKNECGDRLGSINSVVQRLELELTRVRAQVEHQSDANKALVGVKMKLEAEIKTYQELMNKISNDESLGLSLADAVNSEK